MDNNMFRPWEKVDFSNENSLAEKNEAHVRSSTYLALNLLSVHKYLLDKIYPSYIITKNQKANFRRQCKPFTVDESKTLLYRKKIKNNTTCQNDEKLLPVILDKKKQNELISMTHRGTDSSVESISLSAHRSKDACISIIESRMFWPNIYSEVCNFIKECDICQKVNPAVLKAVPELQPVTVPTTVMKQIGIDIATLPEVNQNKYIIVAIDYFSKWSEIKAVQNKTAETVTRFLFHLICRHSCMSIQINDQGREFVNQVSDRLHVFTGTKQRITSAYHPQSNGLVERQNRTIKNMI
ncbi:unnamed protein product [Macrosiphum euphorbiae]|uniref:RNA-directed DNA polymerase n=1 Tax=Macrosiphum euphorbiae TaxID=13131 RepID=A0AAV0WQZ6_9HEMI|nr:unnamed protein product [Macrosiphum euphorbiae]